MQLHTGVCGDTVRESVLKVDTGKKIPRHTRGIEPASAACRSDALPTELYPHPCRSELTYGHESIRKKKREIFF